MKSEETTQQSLDIQAPQEVETVKPLPNIRTSQEVIAQIRYNTKKEVQKIIIKPNFFKCRDYIAQCVQLKVDRILRGQASILPLKPKETYTQYVKRIKGKK